MLIYFLLVFILSGIYGILLRWIQLKYTGDVRLVYLFSLAALLSVWVPAVHTQSIHIHAFSHYFLIIGGYLQHFEISHINFVLTVYLLGILWTLIRLILGFFVVRRMQLEAQLDTQLGQTYFIHPYIKQPTIIRKKFFISPDTVVTDQLQFFLRKAGSNTLQFSKIFWLILHLLFWFNPFFYWYHKLSELTIYASSVSEPELLRTWYTNHQSATWMSFPHYQIKFTRTKSQHLIPMLILISIFIIMLGLAAVFAYIKTLFIY